MTATDRYSRERRYRGWCIVRVYPSGYWRADKLDNLPLLADTLAGIRQLITNVESGAYVR